MVIDSAHLPTPYLVPLHQAASLPKTEVGLRSQGFQRLVDLNISIPKAYILTATAVQSLFVHNHFDDVVAQHFLETKWSDETTRQALSQKLIQKIRQFTFPEEVVSALNQLYVSAFDNKFVAIRPSLLYADHPSDHLSELYVKGEANLGESILRVLSKLYQPEYLPERYREWQQEAVVPAAILLQHMVDATSSGLAVTAHPITGDQHTIFIAAVWGVPSLSLSELKQADTFEVSTRSWQMTQRRVQIKKNQFVHQLDALTQKEVPVDKQTAAAISDPQVMAIAQIAQKIGQTGVSTQVVEWAIESPLSEEILVLNTFPLQTSLEEQAATNLLTLAPAPTRTKILAVVEPGATETTHIPWLADGLGMLKSEQLLTQLGEHPQRILELHREDLIKKAILEAIFEHRAHLLPQQPLLYRSQNLTSADLLALQDGESYEPDEVNPFLGYRGGLRTIHNYDIFNLEADVLAEAHRKFKIPIGLVLPFVRTSTELAIIKKHLLAHNAYAVFSQHLWLECDVPANLLSLPEYLSQQPEGIIIHLQNIYALLLGFDPNNPDLIAHYPLDTDLLYHILTTVRDLTAPTATKVYLYLDSVQQALVDCAVGLGLAAVLVPPKLVALARQSVQVAEQGKLWP